MPKNLRAGAFVLAILTVLIFSSCGGGGSTPVTPTPIPINNDPVNRIVVISGPWAWGGVANSLVGYATVGVYNQWQLRMDTRINGQWVALDEQYTLTYAVNSGHNTAQISFGFYDKDWRGGWLLKVKPETLGQGYVDVYLSGPYVPKTTFHIIFQAGGNPVPSCRDLHPSHENISGFWWDCVNGTWSNTGVPVNPAPTCRDLHPIKEAINGFWWDCVQGDWVNTGVPVNPPAGKDLFPLVGSLDGFYSGSTQSLTLELKPAPSGVGFINWEIVSGPSGAMTVPLGSHPQMQCEFYYTAAGSYTIWATPFTSESDFDAGQPAIGNPAVFTVNISAG